LGLTGLLPRFEGRIYSCYDIGKWKPDPAIFLYAADQLGLNPQDGLVIEDSPQGVSAALAGGFTVFGYRPHQELGPLGDAHRVFDDMSLLPDLIQRYHG
jgi:beta-phosphoglucomutase-like phosphatase (HAD superfamily)